MSPPAPKTKTTPEREEHRRRGGGCEPFQMVLSQFTKRSTAGTLMVSVRISKPSPRSGRHARLVHVVAVDHRREHGDGDHREDRALVPEGGLAREEREEVADDAPGREDEDVDLWVPEDPEQVLEEHRVAAVRAHRRAGDEEARAEEPVEREEQRRRAEHRDEEHVEDGGEPHAPDRERHLHVRHARRAEADHRHDVVDATHDGGDAGREDGDRHVRLPPPRRAHVGGERRVGRPARGGGPELRGEREAPRRRSR